MYTQKLLSFSAQPNHQKYNQLDSGVQCFRTRK